MLAAYYESNGAARDVLRVGEVATPEPGPGEVRVKLSTSGINPSDVKSRAGLTRKLAVPRMIPHSDGAGVIDKTGDGVNEARLGERVWVWNGAWRRAMGTAAEYIALPAAQAVALPAGASMDDGACLGIPAMTAWDVVDLAGAASGHTLLIHAGAGAVGHYAIQFAKARGATVLTTVSSPEKAAHAAAAGADHVIDYKREPVGERVKAITGHGVDATIDVDIDSNAPLWPQVLRPKGTAVVYGTGGPTSPVPAAFMLTNSITVRFTLVYEMEPARRRQAIDSISSMLASGALINTVAHRYPLAEIAAAHEAMESGRATGKILLAIG